MGPRGPAYSGPVSPLLDHALVTWNPAILLGPNDLSSFPESAGLCLRALLPGVVCAASLHPPTSEVAHRVAGCLQKASVALGRRD